MTLRWTREAPKVPGWYWTLDCEGGMEWAGPIPLPEDEEREP